MIYLCFIFVGAILLIDAKIELQDDDYFAGEIMSFRRILLIRRGRLLSTKNLQFLF